MVLQTEGVRYVSILCLRCGGSTAREHGVTKGLGFNSLFEMPRNAVYPLARLARHSVSILCLRCMSVHTHHALRDIKRFQFSV